MDKTDLFYAIKTLDPRTVSSSKTEKTATIESKSGLGELNTPLSKGAHFFVVGHKENQLVISRGSPKFSHEKVIELRDRIERVRSVQHHKILGEGEKFSTPDKLSQEGEVLSEGKIINEKLTSIRSIEGSTFSSFS